ncbi:GGDEF domain-containing protein [Sediminibacillus massiliensis]|uniref:GGDEF domain-containing protein n=1 Tax=Sediminibacillus massiliensis TaxID=1926277 RepID=UPI0015C34B55|nr:sensor domain-containing diguanylate cyclase [Sediminibacillus massiliensis]
MRSNQQISLWLGLILIWPVSIFICYRHLSTEMDGLWMHLFVFGLLMCAVALFPIVINDTPIFFVNGISLAVFIYFGVYAEAILTQAAILSLLASLRLEKKELYRIPVNLLMFLFVSFVAAMVYWGLGGDHGPQVLIGIDNLIPVIGYIFTVFLANQFILYLVTRYVYGIEGKFLDRGFLWEFYTLTLVIPTGIVLYLLYVEIGLSAVLFVGILFIIISFILKLYHSSQRVNNQLQKTSEIGHELTAQMEENEVIDLFNERITELLQVDYILIYEKIEDSHLQLRRFIDIGHLHAFPEKDRLIKFESISGTVWGNKRGMHFHHRRQWSDLNDKEFDLPAESILSLPIERDNEVIGVLTLMSKQKRAFDKYQYMILSILTNYLAVAMLNASHYKETKRNSERDPLTKLFNYRYFESYLSQWMDNTTDKMAAVILIDMDHFKSINDTYGHQSGNEILKQLAVRLETMIGDKGIVARYGGEEFIVFLPSATLQQGHLFAETIREEIAEEPFYIKDHILEEDGAVKVGITASIGVASYPEDCNSPEELVRCADRAMYIGAKRRGRNRVAVMEK